MRAIYLTAREKEVFELIAEGHSSQEVADTLFISKRTVDFYMLNILERLGAKNRIQAINIARRNGLIEVVA